LTFSFTHYPTFTLRLSISYW